MAGPDVARKERGGPTLAALLVGVVIGVLNSRVTWPLREQELTFAGVLLILVLVWSGYQLHITQKAGGPVAREGGGGNCPHPSRSVCGWALPGGSVRYGEPRVETKEGQGLLSPQACTIPGLYKNKNGGRLGPDSRGHPRPGGRGSENFGIQGLELGRTAIKILALCAGPFTKPES